jgi:hypothetical protein
MPEYIVGHEFIREPGALLKTADIVETHTHNQHHNTHLTLGLWEVHRYQPNVKADGSQAMDGDGELLWTELPVLTIKGGGPRSIVPISANMKHKFVLLEGPGFYRCCFVHRDADGRPAEVYHGYDEVYA